jgi:AcrR family transcriptional regulator
MAKSSPEHQMRDLGLAPVIPGPAARERLLAEVFVLFYANGIRAVGIDLAIARAGVAKATFYNHFPSKAALVLVYLERRNDAFLRWLDRDVARTRDPRRRLLAVFDSLALVFADPDFRGCPVINAVSEVGDDSPELMVQARGHKADLQRYVAGLAADAGATGPDELASQCCLLIDGAFVSAQRAPGSGAARHAKRAATSLLAGG